MQVFRLGSAFPPPSSNLGQKSLFPWPWSFLVVNSSTTPLTLAESRSGPIRPTIGKQSSKLGGGGKAENIMGLHREQTEPFVRRVGSVRQ